MFKNTGCVFEVPYFFNNLRKTENNKLFYLDYPLEFFWPLSEDDSD